MKQASSHSRSPKVQTRAVCTHAECELTLGAFGLTTEQILELANGVEPSGGAEGRADEPAMASKGGARASKNDADTDTESEDEGEGEGEDEGEGGDESEDEEEDTGDDDGHDEGEELPCPACAAADPPRDGTLLLLPDLDHPQTGRILATAFGPLKYWLGAKAVDAAQRHANRILAFEPAKVDGSRYVSGAKIIQGVVLRALPFDGHVLSFGNQDMFVGRAWDRVSPMYGPSNEAPLSTAKTEPTYIRALQKDLLLLGYLGKSRVSKNTPGRFDVHTLGAVLAFKQDLVEIYGVAHSPAPLTVLPRDIKPEAFAIPIHSQAAFLAPLRVLRDWKPAMGKVTQQLIGLRTSVPQRKVTARLVKAITARLAGVTAELDRLPHRFILEKPDQPFTPFEPKAPAMALAELPLPPGEPLHADVRTMVRDPAFDPPELNSRSINRDGLVSVANHILGSVSSGKKRCSEIRARRDRMKAEPGLESEIEALEGQIDDTLTTVEKVLDLVRYVLLSFSQQMTAWIEHVKTLGRVDQPTAVYLKALSEGGRIGPQKRAAYRLATNVDDFGSVEDGATFLRERCRSWGDNRKHKVAVTVPEVLTLQFIGNESGLTFTTPLAPFNLSKADAKLTFVRCGTDMNSHRRGTFDPVHSLAGEWLLSRGWGVGQDTERGSNRWGVELVRGLPILPPGATEVQHPPALASKEASFDQVIRTKMLGNYRKREKPNDCTFQATRDGAYYDCHRCLHRFFYNKLVGDKPYGKGGVFVPRGSKTFGDPHKTLSHWLDLERITEFARAGGHVELTQEEATTWWTRLFGFTRPPPDDDVREVLRSGTDLDVRVKDVAKARGLDAEQLRAKVETHIEARRDLPCSWFYARLRYSGSGEQALASLQKLLRVVGQLESSNDVVVRHIKAASKLREEEALGGR